MTKTAALATLLAALLAGSTAHAAKHEGAKAQPEAQQAPDPDAPMTLAQFQALRVKRFMHMDADHDGRVSRAEFNAVMGGTGAPDPFQKPRRDMFSRLDTNGDGYVTPDEVQAAAARRFAAIDVEHKGVITMAQVMAARDEPSEPAQAGVTPPRRRHPPTP
jgi:hypothetical protein